MWLVWRWHGKSCEWKVSESKLSHFLCWRRLTYIYKNQPVDGKKKLCCLLSYFCSLLVWCFISFVKPKFSHNKEHFMTKTGEAFSITETTQSMLQKVIYIMHVWGQSALIDCVNMQFVCNVMTRTNQNGWEVPNTGLCFTQIMKSIRSVFTGCLILKWQVILGGVANHFVTLKFGKDGSLVASAVRGRS